jgi:DNA processing protein
VTRPAPTAAERADWLRLSRAESVGPVAFAALIRRFGSAAAALAALPDLARRGGRAGPPRIPGVDEAAREIAAGEALGARLLIAAEPAYPALLAAVDPPPPLIWALGEAAILQRPCVAIVGARIASAAGQRFARTLAHDLGQAGFVVVSGLARGVDRAAHDGALATGTAAVLAGGPDDIYPQEHAALYRDIAAQGCIVSEQPPGYRATARDFPRRNRIISGLSRAVVVVEAEIRSGSLITARLAGEQGRDVLAVPGSPLDPRARGANDLLRQGAAVCEGAEDVIRLVGALGSLREPHSSPFDGDDDGAADDALRESLAQLLSPTPVTRDELVRITGARAGEVAAALVELSLAGRAELLPGGLAALA